MNYRPKVYSSSESFLNVFDIDAHLDYEVWFYPEEYTKDLNIKKSDQVFQKDNRVQIYEKILQAQRDDKFKNELKKYFFSVTNLSTRFFGFDNKHFELIDELDTMTKLKDRIKDLSEEMQCFYILDQLGEYRIINSYLSKLTIKSFSNESADHIKQETVEIILRQKRTEIDKIEIGIGDTIEGLMHYVKCMRFSQYDSAKKRRILLSPDYVMMNRKGSVYEHNIYFACILLNYLNEKKDITYEKYIEKMAKRELDIVNELPDEEDNNNKNDRNLSKIKESEGKENETLKEKNVSSNNLILDLDKTNNNIEEVAKLNPKNSTILNKNKTKEKPEKSKDKKTINQKKKKNEEKKINLNLLKVEKIEPVK